MPHDASARSQPHPAWPGMIQRTPEEILAYDRMVATLRGFLDGVAGAKPDAATLAALTADLAAWTDRLAGLAVDEREQVFGRLVTQAGRGQALAPCFLVDSQAPGEIRGRVTFGRFYLGVGGAVHGGALPLLFDEVLGRAAAAPGRVRIRTAYLNVAFKALTPIGTELAVTGRLDRIEGRKLFVRGELRHGEILCAEAEGLFVELRPEQG